MNDTDLHEKLSAPFPASDLEWRVQRSGITKDGKPWAMIVPYISNRAIQERLDVTVGPSHWRNEYRFQGDTSGGQSTPGVLCGIAILDDVTEEWVMKWDGAEQSDIESFKGGLSNAMKRAAVQWGMGRYLYSMAAQFANLSDEKVSGAEVLEIKDSGGQKHRYYWTAPGAPTSNGNGSKPAAQQATTTPSRAPAQGAQTASHECPQCGGPMWDNRENKRNPRSPDFKCKDRSCEGVIWPERSNGKKQVAAARDGGDVDDYGPETVYDDDNLPF
jgi:hypothetical protein